MSIDRKLTERKQATPDQVLKVLKGRKGKGIGQGEIAETLRAGKRSVAVAIKSLIKSGYLVSERGGSYYLDSDQQPGKYEFEYKSRADGKYKFGFSSDQHIASKYSRIDVLEDLYDKFAEQKVDRVINCGNWIDGEARFNKHDLLYHGLDNQIGALVDLYPQRAGIKTYAVAGDDHEGWASATWGVDVGKFAENAFIDSGRNDWVDTGYMESYMNLVHRDSGKSAKLLMMHPGGGSAYAHCFDDQTEVLTEVGWKFFKELPKTVRVATLNRDSGELEYQYPTDYIDQHYEGDMVSIRSKQVDMVVTPNHRLWVRRPWDRWSSCKSTGVRSNSGPQFIEASDVKGRDWCIPRTAKWVGKHISRITLPEVTPEPHGVIKYEYESLDAGDFLELIGWFVSEGSLGNINKQVHIAQSAGPLADELVELCKRLGYNPYFCGRHVVITSIQLLKFFRDLGLGHSHEKFVPDFIKELTPELIWRFLDGYLKGDGCRQDRGGREVWHSASTCSPKLADDIQELFLKTGGIARIAKRAGVVGNYIGKSAKPVMTARDQHVLSFNYTCGEPCLPKPSYLHYSGRIYCVSVPNQTVCVRRNGVVCFSGNSYKPQKIVESLGGGEKPGVLLIGHYHKLSYNVIRNVHAIQSGTTQDQTPFMRKKGIDAHVGGGICELTQDAKTGAITSCKVEFFCYYNEGYYNNRWSHSGSVTHPKRGLYGRV